MEIARGIFHGAMAIYFDRWFNMPAARLPQNRRETETLPTDADELLDGFVELLDTQAQADRGGMYIYRYLSLGIPARRCWSGSDISLAGRRGIPLVPDVRGGFPTSR